MRSVHSEALADLTVAAVRHIDATCDRFEGALQKGSGYRIEDYLVTVEESLRQALFYQLLLLECEYHQQRGECIDLTDYLGRFPKYSALIRTTIESQTVEIESRTGIFGDLEIPGSRLAVQSMRDWEELGYVILGRLGQGGMGTVYLASQPTANRLVAVKALQHGLDNAASIERFRREVQTLARLQHPNIVSIFEVGQHHGHPFYSMEYCSEGSLADYLNQTHLTPHEAAGLVEILARVVHVTHQEQIVHRDLKPSNILVQRRRDNDETAMSRSHPASESVATLDTGGAAANPIENLVFKLADFGLAKELCGTSQTQSGAVLGTPEYMAPEQARGDRETLGVAVDIHSLGAILYECLTRRPPFLGTTVIDTVRQVIADEALPPTRFHRNVPRDLETICLKCLRKEPHARYPDAAALADDLRRFLCHQEIQARPLGTVEKTSRWVKRQPAAAALIGVLVLSAIMALVLATWAFVERGTAVAARARAEAALKEAERQSVLTMYAQAVSAGDRESRATLPRLAFALQAAIDAEAHDLEASIRRQLGARRRDWLATQDVFFHGSHLFAVASSPDGRLILTGGADHMARVWDAATGEPVYPPLRHQDTVFAVAFSPDGNKVLTGSGDHTAQLWDTHTGKRLRPALMHENRVLAVAFSPDGKKVLTGSHDRTAKLWDVATGEPIGAPLQHADIVRCVAFSPAGDVIATGGDDGAARCWETATGKPLGPSIRHPDTIFAVAFSPDGTRLLTGSKDGTAQLWDAVSGKPSGPTLQHQGWVMAVDFNSDGETLLTGSTDNTVRLWKVGNAKSEGQLRHQGEVRAAAFTHDDKAVITACFDGTTRRWDVTTPRLLQYQGPVRVPALRLSEQTGATSTDCAFVPSWQTSNHTEPSTPHDRNVVRAFAFSPNGKVVLTGGADGAVRLCNTITAVADGHVLQYDELRAAAFSPDGKLVLTGGRNKRAQLWDVTMGQPVGPPLWHRRAIQAVAFSPDGRIVLTGSWDTTAQLWDVATGKRLGQPLQHSDAVFAVAFSPDGLLVATGCNDKNAQLWDASTCKRVGPPMHHHASVRAVAFSPDGSTFLSSSDDETAQLWDVANGMRLGPPLRHQSSVRAVAFTADGKGFLTGCADGDAFMWTLLPPILARPEHVALWSQVTTGLEADEQGSIRILDLPTWTKRRQELGQLDTPLHEE